MFQIVEVMALSLTTTSFCRPPKHKPQSPTTNSALSKMLPQELAS
jgi:hypothetical protein